MACLDLVGERGQQVGWDPRVCVKDHEGFVTERHHLEVPVDCFSFAAQALLADGH